MSRRIVFVHASDLAGGAERSLCEIADGLRRRGHSVQVWNAGHNPVLQDWLAERGLVSRSLPAPRFGERDWPGFLRHGLALAGRWLVDRPDLVHANNLPSTKYAAAVAAAFGLPLVGHVRDEPELDRLTTRLLGRASLLLAISDFIARSLGRIPGVRVEVLHNAVDCEATPAQELAGPDEPLRLVTPATYRPNKRLELVLETAERLRAAGAEFRWTICGPTGDPTCRDELRARHAASGLGDRVALTGALPPAEVYAEADVVVSTADREPFGRTVIEGQLRALPVVGFDSGALPELIESGRTGTLVRDGDAAAMAAGILDLVRDRALARRLGAAGRRSVLERFSLDRLLDELEAHHASVL